MIWRVVSDAASNTAFPSEISETFATSVFGSAKPSGVVGDPALAYRVHTSTSPSYGSTVSISWSISARIAISSDAIATSSSDS